MKTNPDRSCHRVLLLAAAFVIWVITPLRADAAEFFGGGGSPGTLLSVTASGSETFIGNLPFSAQLAMAYVPGENRIYSFDNASDQLYRINPGDGSGVAVAVLPFGFVHGLAYDKNNGILYGHDINTGMLFTIDRVTGATTNVGSTGVGFIGGLEYDHNNDTLYGIEVGGTLFRFNVGTGAATNLGLVSGFATSLVTSLGIDHRTGLMYAVDDSNQWYEFDRNVRVASALATLSQRLSGLTTAIPEPSTLTLITLAALPLVRQKRSRKRPS